MLLFWTPIVLIGLAAFIITRTYFLDEEQFKASEKLEDQEVSDKAAKHGFILKYSRPFFKRYVSPIVSSMKGRRFLRDKYKKPLASSGLTEVLTPEDFFSFKLFLILGFPVMFLIVRKLLEEDWPLILIPIIALLGFIYPDIWIRGKKTKRQEEIIMALPFCVDMLALSVEAGLDFVAAMTKVIEKAKPSALVEELNILMKEIKIGSSRAEALRNFAWRADIIQVSSLSATLIAADSVGASIGPILKSLSVEIRQKKSSDIEKKGSTAATKIIFPTLLIILPAVLIIIITPLVIQNL
ncbi:MAG: type II secretion system F family protein [Halobacteriovoraceae bacterium]|nr:type II secretion system F family protein [Halobacteriovoraceae bacterium]